MRRDNSAGIKKGPAIRVLFSLIALLVSVGLADAALQCYDCHGTRTPADNRPLDGASRNLNTGAFQGNHRTHMDASAAAATCTKCHGNSGYTSSHRDGNIQVSANVNASPATGQYNKSGSPVTSFPQTATPTLGSCSNVNCHFESTTPTWGSAGFSYTNATTNDCNKCHGTLSSPAPNTGTHNTHAGQLGSGTASCVRCHPGYTTFSHATSAGKRNLQVSFSDGGSYSGTTLDKYLPSQSAQRSFGSCSSTYCHMSGAPTWGGALSDVAECDSCHGGNRSATGPAGIGPILSGKHSAHIANADANLGSFACGRCHSATVTTGNDRLITGSSNHVNGAKNVAYDSLNSGASAGTCSTVYCHSDGKGGYNDQTLSTAWYGATTYGCKGCHGDNGSSQFGEPDYTNTGAGAPRANSHSRHAVAASECATCHSATTTTGTGITGSAHLNGAINIAFGSRAGGSAAYDAGTKTCSTTYCHGASSIQWGGALADVPECDSCHGGNSSSTLTAGIGSMTSGSHADHMNQAAVIGTNYQCAECHNTTVTIGNDRLVTGMAHVDGANTVSVRLGGSYTAATNSCSTVYCHSSGKGSYATPPTWGSATNLGCNACHGTSTSTGAPDYATTGAGQPNANSHGKHVLAASDCDKCHTNTTTTGSAIKTGSTLHTNASIDVTFNTAKAGSGAAYASGTKTCSSTYCHGVASIQWGGALADGPECDSCHGGNSASSATAGLGPLATGRHSQHMNQAAVLGTNLQCGECHNTTVTLGNDRQITGTNHVNLAKNVSIAKGGTWSSPNCSTAYCHSTGKTSSPTANLPAAYGSSHYTTMSWAGTAIGCNGCHGKTTATGAPDYTNAGANVAGSNSHGKHGYTSADCDKCHTNTTTTGLAIKAGSALHVNNAINVSFNTARSGASASWTAGTKTCSSTYCHGATNVVWGGTIADATQCDSCHGGNSTATNVAGLGAITSGNHTDHMNQAAVLGTNFQCAECHNATVSAGNDRLVTNTDNHANTTRNVVFRFGSGSWTPASSTCSSVYCHSNGKGTFVSPPTWGSTTNLGCTSCHGTSGSTGAPDYANGGAGTANANSHPKHAAVSGDCDKCHTNTTTTGTAIRSGSLLHSNNAIDVTFNTAKAGTSATWTAGTKTCSTTYCHGAATVQWGGAIADVAECDSCHGGNALSTATAGFGPISLGGHTDHMNQASVLGTNYQCAECHNTTVSIGNDRTITGTNHVNLTKNVSMRLGGTWAVATTSCSSVYCHSNGKGTFVNPPTWGNTTNLGCNGCHGTSTSTGAPDYANTGAGATNANSHGKHATTSADCDACHTNTTTTGLVIKTGSTLHTNNAREVTFNTAKAGASATYTAGTKTCSNISCHGGASAQWGATLTCTSCHGATADTVNYVYNDGTMAKINTTEWTYSGHGKGTGTYDITGATAANFPGAAGTGDPCLYCHDSTNFVHGNASNPMRLRNFAHATYGKNGVCLACHGTGQTGVDPDGASTVYDNKTATKKIDKYHFGSQHSSTLSGGQFCWDCHDSHGDRSNSTTGPIAMIHLNPAEASNATTGVPTTIASTAVTFTAKSAGSDFGKTTSPYNGVCNVCHTYKAADPNKMVHYTKTSSDSHNSTQLCTNCHKHNANTTYDGNAYKGQSDCITCHTSVQGSRQAVMSDFIRPSRHVTNGTTTSIVTNFDCIVCHAEGDPGSSGTNIMTISSLHTMTSGTVDLRNVDNAAAAGTAGSAGTNYWTWGGSRNTPLAKGSANTAQRDNMDTFCMNCHDDNGASTIAVNNTNDGLLIGTVPTTTIRTVTGTGNSNTNNARAQHRPFNTNDTLQNVNDKGISGNTTPTFGTFRLSTYGRVLNVKSQFNSGNLSGTGWASHHNLNQFTKRYSTNNTTSGTGLPTTAWTAYVTKEGFTMNGTGAGTGANAGLHCSDCHLNEVNAHGSANSWYMLAGKSTASDSDVAPTLGNSSSTAEITCFRCHNANAYSVGGSDTTSSKAGHSSRCNNIDVVTGTAVEAPFGNMCHGCHGGFGDVSQAVNKDSIAATTVGRGALGAIHGTNETYDPGPAGGITSKRYRFMNGAAMRRYNPNGLTDYSAETQWNNSTGACYTITAADQYASCTRHGSGVNQTIQRSRALSY